MKQFDWNGVMPAITTQFDKNGVLDLKSFRNNLSNQIKAGVHGIILGGTLGEASTLKDLEKKELLATTLDEVNGKIPVIMNIAEQATSKAVDLAKQLESEGADGLMLLPPMRYKANDQETVAYFSSVASNPIVGISVYSPTHILAPIIVSSLYATIQSPSSIAYPLQSSHSLKIMSSI